MASVDEQRGILLTGLWDELAELREALEREPRLGIVADSGHSHSVVVHAVSRPDRQAAEVAAIREHTTAPIVLLAVEQSAEQFEAALAAGVSDVLVQPLAPESLVFAVQKASIAAQRTVEDGAPASKVITVFSPKGGTGKSVTSTNLATYLARVQQRRVLLVDLDVQFGDVAIMLGLEPTKTLYDLVAAPGELDAEKLAGYTVRHSSGVNVLAAPHRPEEAELVGEEKVAAILEVAADAYDVVVVDTSPHFHGPMLSALDRTDELLLLTSPDVPTLKNVRLTLQTLELISFPSDRIRLVLNRASEKSGISADDLSAALDVQVQFQLPSDPAVPQAVNRGNVAVLADAETPFSVALRGLAEALSPSGAARPARSRRFRLPLQEAAARLSGTREKVVRA